MQYLSIDDFLGVPIRKNTFIVGTAEKTLLDLSTWA